MLLLGEILYVERRLAGGVLQQLIEASGDAALVAALTAHLTETREHVDRVETAFRLMQVAPTANYSASFESAAKQHDALDGSIATAGLSDAFHAVVAARTEHWEIASYTFVLGFGEQAGYRDELVVLSDSLHEEEHARDALMRFATPGSVST